jgi:hypothetical protein
MATYKVLQDIEAEDKLFGPLTLKQFIFAAIFIALGFIQFTTLTSSAPTVIKVFIFSIFVLPMLVFGFLAAPISQDQPNDIWLLARLRFILKPHVRIWNQDGISELVTITAPKREVHVYTNGLSQVEVKSRLQALANTMDTRGWAVKNVSTNLYAQPGYLNTDGDSDRLIDPSSLPQDVPAANVTASDDILDTANNPTAQHLDQLVQASTKAHKQQAITQMTQDPATTSPQNYYFMNQSAAPQAPMPQDYAVFSNQQVVAPGTHDDVVTSAPETPADHELAEKLQHNNQPRPRANPHIKTLSPLHDRNGNLIPQPPQTAISNPTISQTTTPNPAILGLAHNDDLNVATIARQAKKLSENDDEVVISLH